MHGSRFGSGQQKGFPVKHIAKKVIGLAGVAAVLGCICASAQAPAPQTPGKISLLGAVQSTLLNHPLLHSQEAQVDISRGLFKQAAGQFDLLTQSSFGQNRTTRPLSTLEMEQDAVGGVFTSRQISNLTAYSFSLSKLLHNGVSVAPSLQLNRSTDNLFNGLGSNVSTLSLVISVPLMRNRGTRVTAAQENAARTEIDASLYDVNHLIAQLMFSTVNSYWSFVAARKTLNIAVDSEARGKIYLENVQALVAADRTPRNDLNEALANLAQRSANRIATEQNVLAAQQQLALDMGLTADAIGSWVSEPSDDFPTPEKEVLLSDNPHAIRYYLEQALANRADYLSSQRRTVASGIRLNAAKNRLLPQLSLNLGAGYSGLQQGGAANDFFASSTAAIRGPNASIGFTYSFSGRNQVAEGAFLQSQAQSRQAEYQTQESARNVSAAVVTAVGAVNSAALRSKKAREAVESYQDALIGEREKYKAGMSSIVSLLTVEDKLTGALLDELQAQLAYAIALAQFRFATGTLVAPNRPVQNVDSDIFFTLPFVDAPNERP